MAHEKCGRSAKSTGEPCQRPAGWGTDNDEGACKFHGGASDGAPEGNDNAVDGGAYKELASKTLTQGEERAFDEVRHKLDKPDASAQSIAAEAAAYCLTMAHRTDDPRWFRRFENICEKFNLAPDDVQRHEVTGDGGGPIEVDITNNIVSTDGDE